MSLPAFYLDNPGVVLLLLGQVWDRRREEMLQHLTFSSLWIVPNLKSVFPLMTPYFGFHFCGLFESFSLDSVFSVMDLFPFLHVNYPQCQVLVDLT